VAADITIYYNMLNVLLAANQFFYYQIVFIFCCKMTKPKSSNAIAKLKHTIISLFILMFVLFISITPSLAAVLPAVAASHTTSAVAVDSNLADALPSASTSAESEPEYQGCGSNKAPSCQYDSSKGKCISKITNQPC